MTRPIFEPEWEPTTAELLADARNALSLMEQSRHRHAQHLLDLDAQIAEQRRVVMDLLADRLREMEARDD